MSASRFIASKLSDGDGRLSHTSNTIAWISVCLSVAIMIIVLAFNFLGDGLRDVLDPYLQTR